MKKEKHFFLTLFSPFIMVVLLLAATSISAQEAKKIDSILDKANLMVYEDPDKAISIVNNLLLQNKLSTKQQANALLTIAGGYSAKRHNQRAIEYGLKVYRLAEKEQANNEQVRALGFIGNQYHFLKMHDKVNLYLDMAEEIMDKKIDKDSLHFIKGNVYFVKGVNYKDKLDCDVAISYFDKSIAEYTKTTDNNSKNLNLSIALIQKGLCLTDQLQLNDARAVLIKAKNIAFKNGYTENEYYTDIALAKTYFAENDYRQSNAILFKIEKQVDVFHGLNLQNEFYSALADNFLKLNDYENYNTYSKKYLKGKIEIDSLEVNSFHNLISEIAVEKGNTLKTQNRNEDFYIVIAFVLFLLLALFLAFKIFKVKKSLRNREA